MPKKFLRQDISRYSKLGSGRKKLQKWRKPKGRHSKMRQRRRSYPSHPSLGHKRARSQYKKIKDKLPILVSNKSDLSKIKKENAIILSGRLGARKKIEIINKAEEMKLQILNMKGEKK
mgnify:FL=1